jgi:hypothetical protein
VDDDSFPLYVAGRLAGLPGVEAVTLGGSRAEGTQRPDSDWDFSIYYRGRFDPQALRVDGLIAATGPDPAALRDGPSARTRCGQFIPCESYVGDIGFCAWH